MRHPLLAAVALLLATGVSAQGSVRIGVFDPQKLLTNSKLGQTLQDGLNRYRVEKEAEIKTAGEDLKKRQEQYTTGVQTMSPERREEVQADLQARMKSLERMTRDADEELRRRQQKAVRELEQEVAVIIEDFGKKNGYTLILQRDYCAYASEVTDVSDELVQLLDARRQQ